MKYFICSVSKLKTYFAVRFIPIGNEIFRLKVKKKKKKRKQEKNKLRRIWLPGKGSQNPTIFISFRAFLSQI